MASGFDVAGPAAGAAFASGDTFGGYENDFGIGAKASPEQLAAMEAAQAQAQEAKSQSLYNTIKDFLFPSGVGASANKNLNALTTKQDIVESLVGKLPSNLRVAPENVPVPVNITSSIDKDTYVPPPLPSPFSSPREDIISGFPELDPTAKFQIAGSSLDQTIDDQYKNVMAKGYDPLGHLYYTNIPKDGLVKDAGIPTYEQAGLPDTNLAQWGPSGWFDPQQKQFETDLIENRLSVDPNSGVKGGLAPTGIEGLIESLYGKEPGIFNVLSPIGSAILHAIDKNQRTTYSSPNSSLGASSRRDVLQDIPQQMPTTPPTSTITPDSWGETDDGNVQAIRRFLQDPNYGNMPQIDPASALAAYENAIRGIDAVVGERGFTDRGFAQAARDRSKTIFDEFQAGQDFDSMLNEKIGRAFADEALFNKDIELRGQGVQAVEQAFPQGFESDIFNPEAFSKAAENIYGQKLQGAQDIIARAGSRGQLSPRGGRLASESLLSQGPDVQSRLTDILGGVRSEAEGGYGGIKGSALEAAQGYQLGDELFDVTPFADQAAEYTRNVVGELPGRISTAVGTDPLFSAVSALQEGGRQQGQVSGTPSFLDALAEREGGVGTGKDRRGLGSRGSGVF